MTCTDAQFEAILEEITAGKTISQACDSNGVALHVFQKAVRTGGNERNVAYARALEQRADILCDQTLEIADDPNKDPNRARNQMQARQWVASKHNKQYNDRIDLNVNQSLDITAILADARQRVRLISDQQQAPELQAIEYTMLPASSATDNESVSVDIFS